MERLEELGAKDLYESLKFELGRADEVVQEMLKKCEHIDAALKHTSEPVENSEWIFGSECDGTTTHYILEYDGTISLHVRGILTDVPLFEQLCVIYEIGLYSQWVPFLFRISYVEANRYVYFVFLNIRICNPRRWRIVVFPLIARSATFTFVIYYIGNNI